VGSIAAGVTKARQRRRAPAVEEEPAPTAPVG
jgi:hypothetical protein